MTVLRGVHKGEALNNIASYYQIMLDHGDAVNAKKMLSLYKKIKKEEFQISFSGHFSAGKSSMINALLDKEILPKSPIPTSANIVKISSGEGSARIYFKHEAPIEFDEPYDMDSIKEYCKNKDEIAQIELNTAHPLLVNGSTIVDTPGIDAADDADRILTESSLHLVDLLFYVMDYNHVQSEVNLYFLKKLQDQKIPYYIIINQIDKHDENEITLQSYREKIKQTFDQWNLIPKDIFYSSLIDKDVAYNQFSDIREKIVNLLHNKQMHIRVEAAIQQIVQDHQTFLKEIYDEKTANLGNDVSTGSNPNSLESITKQITSIQNKPIKLENAVQEIVTTTLKNAYLMPAELRDKAKHFLESQTKDFKVGFIGSKKKTMMERQQRTEEFLQSLRKTIEASIQWALQNKLTKLIKDFNITNPTILQLVQHINIAYTENDIQQLIKHGAKINGEYVLNFTNDISADIKKRFRQEVNSKIIAIIEKIKEEDRETLSALEKEQNAIKQMRNKQQQWASLQQALDEQLALLDNLPMATDATYNLIENELHNQPKPIKTKSSSILNFTKKTNKKRNELQQEKESNKYNLADVVEMVEKTIQSVEELPGFQSIIDDLQNKKTRLINQTFTIALFGAFSAGKSSFANALMGEKVLPVSPNPTTAVINRILPPSKKYAHGTVIIHIKEESVLTEDIKQITRTLELKGESFSEVIEWIVANNVHNGDQLDKIYQNYLQALVTGYEEHREFLGKESKITIDEFAPYVTDESKACYIEAVDLYYDCSITKQGITLVDTPGADSVNARHTNVAFDYIKYADAILYVTYYNHALSRADRDFLMQLGRVKDSFQLDKMFFIVNASDLAEDKSELNMVIDYVEEQLVELGIRFPRIFPLSSKQSALEKINGKELNEEIQHFEQNLYTFIHYDLSSLLAKAAVLDMNRVKKTLANYIHTAQLSNTEKDDFRIRLLQKQEQLEDLVYSIQAELYEQRMLEKMRKQLHYVHERLSIRFHDLFKDRYNPTTVTESGKKVKRQLMTNLTNLMDDVGYELLQEVRAVSLRMEAYMSELVEEIYEDTIKNSSHIDQGFILPSLNDIHFVTPEYEQPLTEVRIDTFEKTLALFKGKKAFFVNNEKEKMKEAMFRQLSPEIKSYLSDINGQMSDAYKQQWNQLLEENKQHFLLAMTNYVEDQLSVMNNNHMDVNILQEKQRLLQSIIVSEGEYNEK